MLFLVISEPRPEPPSSVNAARQRYWTWLQPLIDKGEVRSVHAKVGRGAVVLFDVPSNEVLHAHLNAWADIIPARFEIHALIESASARRFLTEHVARPETIAAGAGHAARPDDGEPAGRVAGAAKARCGSR